MYDHFSFHIKYIMQYSSYVAQASPACDLSFNLKQGCLSYEFYTAQNAGETPAIQIKIRSV